MLYYSKIEIEKLNRKTDPTLSIKSSLPAQDRRPCLYILYNKHITEQIQVFCITAHMEKISLQTQLYAVNLSAI